jgi:hypothetical protein
MAKVKVRMLEGMASQDGSWIAGDEYEADAAEAKRMIESGAAEAIKPAAKTTTKKADTKEGE